MCRRRGFRFLIITTLCFCSCVWAELLHAQAAGPGEPAPVRGMQRTAPTRTPRLLTQTPLASGALNAVVELPVVADSYIASARPNQNFGADSLFLGYNVFGDNFGAQRIVLRFDTAGTLPAGAQINNAQLRLRLAFASPAEDLPMGTVLRRLASDWSETGVNWNSEPQWTDVDDRASVGSALGWYEWDVRTEVEAWVNGTPNYGLEIIGDERIQERERAFYSRETTTGYFPRLVVDYTVNADQLPPAVTVDPLPAFVGRNFTVSWHGSDPGGSGIAGYDVQYRVDEGEWIEWLSGVTFTAEEFADAKNGRRYEFRARGVDNTGNAEAFGDAEAATSADTAPPTARVTPLPAVVGVMRFTVTWSGTDGTGAGIQYFDVRYRMNGGAWQVWQQQTSATSALFIAPGEGVYEFEARAVDNRGLVEDYTGGPDTGTIVNTAPPYVQPQLWFALVSG